MKNIIKNIINLKNTLVLIFILGLNVGVIAQDYITIGTGTSASHLSPMNRGKNYSTHELLYLQSELGGANNFTKIAFHKKSGDNTDGIENVTIYMKHTTESTFATGNYSMIGYSLIFSGTFTNNTTSGWMEVTLDNTFLYNGNDNLQVLIIKGYQSSVSKKPQWSYTQLSEYRTRGEADNGSQPTNLKRDKQLPNIRIVYNTSFAHITIGYGIEAQEVSPMNRKHNYSTHELIYLQSELGNANNFTKIAFHKKEGDNTNGIENVTIYMKHTSDTTFEDGTYSLDGYSQVFSGTYTNNATNGWMEITLGSAFPYNGSDNLQILIIKGYQSKTETEPKWCYTSLSENRTRNAKDNNSQPTLLEASNNRPNIRIEYESPNPVELTSFTSSIKDRNVTLNWSTAIELNNAGFEVERKTVKDGSRWMKIGFVKGNGTTNEPKNYTFSDAKLETGKYNYRLIQIDYNNAATIYDLSNTIDIGVPKKPELSQNYPNPFNPVTKIDYNLPSDGKVSMKIYDITGREIITLVNETKTAGYYTVQFDASNFASGTYFYSIATDDGANNFIMTKRMIFVK